MMEGLINILDTYGYVTTIIVFIAIIVGFVNWFMGISPALWRLGKGLACRKIAILAENDAYVSLKDLLLDSNLFRKENIVQVTNSDIQKAEKFTLLLAHWKSISAHLKDILAIKKDSTALLIYAPQGEGFIDKDAINTINEHRNVIIVNFRGRLLNDIVTSLITTGYNKK
jgi:hypothetical protein